MAREQPIRKTLLVLNELEKSGFFRRYAIGGAIGAIFYIEAFETEDLDILILLATGRAKDRERFQQMRRELSLDESRMKSLVDAYDLDARFQEWSSR